MKKIFLAVIAALLLSGNAFAQPGISVWGEDFRDKSGLAVMIHMKAADTSICFKDVKIKTNFGEDSMPSFGCDADNLENYFMVYPGEHDDITKLQIQKLTGTDASGNSVNFANLLTSQDSPDGATYQIDISIAPPAPKLEGGKFAVAGIHLSSSFELNDTVWSFLGVTSERERRSTIQRMNLERSASNLFQIVQELNTEPIATLGLTPNQYNAFSLGLQKTIIQTIGNATETYIAITPTSKTIIYIKYDFRFTPVPVENILPDIKSKFGEPRYFRDHMRRACYVWQDGGSYAVLHGMLEGEQGKERFMAINIELIDYNAVVALANATLKRLRAEQNAQQDQIGSAFK